MLTAKTLIYFLTKHINYYDYIVTILFSGLNKMQHILCNYKLLNTLTYLFNLFTNKQILLNKLYSKILIYILLSNIPTNMSFKPEHEQSLDIENCLGLMTDNDLDKFFNLYKIITSLDPNANALIKKASMGELLSGKLIDKEHLKELCVAKVEESEPSNKEDIDVPSNDYTFFDVYDHIESWKKRMHPMMNKIEDLVEEFKTISQRTSSADILKVSTMIKEQTIKNSNDDVVSNSNRYLSNI